MIDEKNYPNLKKRTVGNCMILILQHSAYIVQQ